MVLWVFVRGGVRLQTRASVAAGVVALIGIGVVVFARFRVMPEGKP